MLTHDHAQSILQAASDGRPVSDPEWTALQAHLETCADCRAYAAALEVLERGLARRFKQDLGPRWAAAQPRDLSSGVIERLRGETAQRRMVGLAGAVGALALLAGLLIGGGLLAPRPSRDAAATQSIPAATSTPTLTPTLENFHGGAAYETNRDGNREIYLVSDGSDMPDNLTQNPANDRALAWSPDGEWLAFLSDRTGKDEVYAIHVSGARLTQLTDAPETTWQPPLSWSSDGSLVALVGVRALQPLPGDSGEAAQSSIYIIPTARDGLAHSQVPGQPTRLGYTAGALSARFSPTLPLLAYTSQRDGLSAYNVGTLGFAPLTWFETNKEGMRSGLNGAYDWSADGRALVYLSEDAETAWVRGTTEISADQSILYNSNANLYIGVVQRPGAVRSVSYGPEKDVAVYLQEQAPGSSCWQITISRLRDPNDRVAYDGLCVTGDLARANWTGNTLTASWLVVAGHRPGEAEDALWAAALPGRSGGELILRRLGSADGLSGGPYLRPTLPDGQRLAIDPTPALASAAALPPVELPASLPGRLALAPWLGNTSGGITAMRPDGSVHVVLAAEAGKDATCPVYSPDGSKIAFLSDRSSAHPLLNEVFVMDADGGNVRQLTRPVLAYSPAVGPNGIWPEPRFSCPVWSPDGTMLAASVENGGQGEVALIPVDGLGEVRRVPVHEYSFIAPVWTPDSQSVILYLAQPGTSHPWISAINREGPVLEIPQKLVQEKGSFFPIAMTFLPDGKTFGFLGLNIPTGERTSISVVFFDYSRGPGGAARLENARTVYSLEGYDTHSYIDGKLGWLPDGRIIFALSSPTNAPVKVKFMALDLSTRQADLIWQTDEVVYGSVLSPDGRWLAFDMESGLYMLNMAQALAGKAGPRRIGDGVMLNIDWR